MQISRYRKAIVNLNIVIATFVCPLITRAQTTLITFDDLNVATLPGGDMPFDAAIPMGYNGFQWKNFWIMDVPNAPAAGSGYLSGLVSAPNLAFNDAGNSAAIISDEPFNLASAYLTAAWKDGLQVEVQGFVGTTLTYDNNYTVNTEAPTMINFNYIGVDEVDFISSYYGYTGQGEQFAMDNMTIGAVPEPNVLALGGLGAAVLVISFSLTACHLNPSGLTQRRSRSDKQHREQVADQPRMRSGLPLEFMDDLSYTTIIKFSEPLAGRCGSALDRYAMSASTHIPASLGFGGNKRLYADARNPLQRLGNLVGYRLAGL